MKSFNDKKSYIAHSIRKVRDMNELTAHELEVISVALFLRRVGSVLR